jgi:uncharacterized protein
VSEIETESEAYSIDGRTFSFRSPVVKGLAPGAYVSVRDSNGADHLGQVLDLHPVPGTVFGRPLLEGTGALLLAEDEPLVDASLAEAGPEAIGAGLGVDPSGGGLHIGNLVDAPEVSASIHAKGFGRHTFVCGQSGSGKTYAMGVVLEHLLHETSLRMVVLDPNSDYVNLGGLLPQSVMGLDDEAYRELKQRHQKVAEGLRVLRAGSGDLKLWLGNLTLRQQATILGLDPIDDAEETAVVLSIIEELGTTRYSPGDLKARAAVMDDPAARRLALRISNLRLDQLEIWADEQHPAIGDQLKDDWRAAVIDLGSLPTARERSIVSAAIVSALWEDRRRREPVLLVVDEAHNVCPQVPSDANQALATEHLIAIAGEGRKFGIFMVLATQRPTKIHENVLSQCDNLVLMRMNSAADITHLVTTFSAVPPSLIRRSANFRLGEGLAYGKIAPQPLIFKTGRRITPEGGSDIPADWASPPS